MELVFHAHALVWFGPREERDDGPDPVTLAALLGIPYRVCDLGSLPGTERPQAASPLEVNVSPVR